MSSLCPPLSFLRVRAGLLAALSCAALLGLTPGAGWAQDYDRPPGSIGRDDPGADPDSGPTIIPAPDVADAGAASVRIGKLEGRIREMTGQIEELQNANRKLVEQFRKFQDDVESRLGSARPKMGAASVPAPAAAPSVADADAKPALKSRRDDAYNPDAASPSDPGKPKPLGSTASAQPDDTGAQPMDLSGGRLRKSGTPDDTIAPTLIPGRPAGAPTTPAVANVGTPASPRAEFDQALGLYKGKQYDDAEKGFSAFIQKNPKSRLAADATYFLGESYAQRGRTREAAEQYLKVVKEYGSSNRAPDALLHLGMSVRSMGSQYKEQACATFNKVTSDYPNAPAYVKAGVERELKRTQC